MTLPTTPLARTKQSRDSSFAPGQRQILAVLLLLLFPAPSRAQAVPQEKERASIGSLTSVGEVSVNDSPAPAEITIFPGDSVRVGASGSATFNMSGKGWLKLSPRSQVLFSSKYEYTAELKAGAVVMNSVSGPNGFTLRIGNDVVVASSKERPALASIDRAPDGSFLVACSEGPVGVLTLLGASGQFLQVGQAVSVAPNGELFPVEQQVSASAAAKSTSVAQKHSNSRKVWGFLGLAAAAGAAGAAAALSHHGGGSQTVTLGAP